MEETGEEEEGRPTSARSPRFLLQARSRVHTLKPNHTTCAFGWTNPQEDTFHLMKRKLIMEDRALGAPSSSAPTRVPEL